MHIYKKLKVWQKSIDLVKDIYSLTKTFPRTEQFGLTSQINRCAVSIPCNIAEGCGRSTDKQLNYFIEISMGSCAELETLLILASNLNFIENET